MNRPKIEILESCASTNTELAGRADVPHGAVLATRTQTAGRGQRGNSWEAEPGKNLTFSIVLRPTDFPAARSFELSMVTALAVSDYLQAFLPAHSVKVKWPNDIYVDDRKICGILIENSFCGTRLDRMIIGIGINVNQTIFLSDAPNPVSLAQLTSREYALESELAAVTGAILRAADDYCRQPEPGLLHERYMDRLWRRRGAHAWHDLLRDETIRADIADVALSGHLTLATRPPRTYAFKELAAIL